MAPHDGPHIRGIHHIKLPVTDIARSVDFYHELLGLQPVPELDHRHAADGSLYARICEVPELGTKLELRLNPEQAHNQRKFDPITIAVADRAMLRLWMARLDDLGIRHSGEIVAVRAWLVTFDDPDQHRLRFYTLESHGPELPPDEDNEWLKG